MPDIHTDSINGPFMFIHEVTGDGGYLIKSYENNRSLTASTTAAGDFPRLQEKDGGIRQQWIFRRVHDGIDSYAIMPSA
ncbi:hypothetical protein R6V09_00140 [Streptomyces sp. W16]|uniref:RICIN domain-containing protein n=1 Tax=Streptomyces sp. W16 TaxID=3076631 RepID=UPI00295AA8AF|nr:hypothetical protein [Streptomyces sp. W16]MDV9168557.1 hypothetical protein [Streptomyces sp. W16]